MNTFNVGKDIPHYFYLYSFEAELFWSKILKKYFYLNNLFFQSFYNHSEIFKSWLSTFMSLSLYLVIKNQVHDTRTGISIKLIKKIAGQK